jgi:hypothetical protein
VNPGYDSAAELNALSAFLLSLTSLPASQRSACYGGAQTDAGLTSGETAGPVDTAAADPAPTVDVADDEPVAKAPAKKAAPKAKAAAKVKEPEPEPAVVIVEEEEEEEGPDYGKLRLEIRTRFANWAEQVGMIEGKALLDSFNVGKFSELDNSQLKAFSNKLAVMEADL